MASGEYQLYTTCGIVRDCLLQLLVESAECYVAQSIPRRKTFTARPPSIATRSSTNLDGAVKKNDQPQVAFIIIWHLCFLV